MYAIRSYYETVYEEGRPSQQMGIVVDAVSEVLDIPAADIEPPPEFGARIRIDFISGMGKINGKFVVLLDVNKILSIDEVAVVAALGQGRITSYNVCYTKLLRHSSWKSVTTWARCVITSYSIHYTKLYES